MKNLVVISLFFVVTTALAAAENWPGWRGPRGDGSSLDEKVPIEWQVDRNTVWKTPLPGVGHASPTVWGDRIFTVSAVEEKNARLLLCLDRKSGKLLWQKTALETDDEGIHRLNSRASSTPATDGERVFVSFLDGDKMFVAAYDFDGNQLWSVRPGVFASKHGFCSSPILWNGKVIINGDHDGPGYLVALDQITGKQVWKIDRPNNTRSYCPPLIREIDGRNQMILAGSKCVASYDPDTGRQHWIIDGPTEQYVASLVYNAEQKLLFLTCGFPEKHMLAIRPDGSGNVTDTHIAWRTQTGASYVPSPVAIGDYFLVVSDNSVGSCFGAKDGEKFWRERITEGEKHSASLTSARGIAFFLSDSGTMTAVKPGPELDIIATNELGENVYASPAIVDGQWIIRGEKHLYCIGE